MINALISSSTSENTIARSDMKQSLTNTMVKPSLKKLSLSFCVKDSKFYSQTKSDQLEAIFNTCICRWGRCTHAHPHRKDCRMQLCETLIRISIAMKYRACADFCSLRRTQQILQGSNLISFDYA